MMLLMMLMSLAWAKDINVFVLDTGLNPQGTMSKYIKGSPLADPIGHGTGVVGNILYGELSKNGTELDPVCDQVKIVMCSYYSVKLDPEGLNKEVSCLNSIKRGEYNIIHISGGGDAYSEEEEAILKKLLQGSHTVMVAAAGNERRNISLIPFYPASLKFKGLPIVIVGNGTSLKDHDQSSNYMNKNMIWVEGRNIYSYGKDGQIVTLSGTSMAAALHTHNILKNLCKEIN